MNKDDFLLESYNSQLRNPVRELLENGILQRQLKEWKQIDELVGRRNKGIFENPFIQRRKDYFDYHDKELERQRKLSRSYDLSGKSRIEELLQKTALEVERSVFGSRRNFLELTNRSRGIFNQPDINKLFESRKQTDESLAQHRLIGARSAFELSEFIWRNRRNGLSPETFISELWSHIPTVESEDDALSYDEFIDKFGEAINFLIEKIRTLDPAWINFITLFALIWGFFTFFYQNFDSKQTEERRVNEIRQNTQQHQKLSEEQERRIVEMETRLYEELKRLKPPENFETFYIVERIVSIKVSPRKKSAHISYLPPNQKVVLLKMKGEWIYVQYFDYIEGIPKSGWGLKKYFKRIEVN